MFELTIYHTLEHANIPPQMQFGITSSILDSYICPGSHEVYIVYQSKIIAICKT